MGDKPANLNNHHVFRRIPIVWKEMALTERLLFELFLMFKMPDKLFILKNCFFYFLWHICNAYLEYLTMFSEKIS